ncbi:hypothetical protein [Sporolactobacillus inulinus]|uniref:hypothetical protein n=1 Tax=Sporolactobacillus inulinus TaxID=2078 RepID=UPI0021CCCE34|nr:hypothetical protein [Sporolactobacillus inulinus]
MIEEAFLYEKVQRQVVALLMAISLIVGAGGSYAVFRFVQNQSEEKRLLSPVVRLRRIRKQQSLKRSTI